MQGRKFPDAPVWTSHWLFDVVCVSLEVGQEVADRFAVELREVRRPRGGDAPPRQLIPTATPGTRYDSRDLAASVVARHGRQHGAKAGATRSAYQTWKRLLTSEGEAPIRRSVLPETGTDVVASPELFGGGLSSFWHLSFRRPLSEFLARSHPSVWSVAEVIVVAEQ